MLVGDTFERNGDLAARIEFFAWHTSASRVEWPSPEDKRSLAVRIEYPNASLLYAAFQTNNRCPGQWGFFVTRAHCLRSFSKEWERMFAADSCRDARSKRTSTVNRDLSGPLHYS